MPYQQWLGKPITHAYIVGGITFTSAWVVLRTWALFLDTFSMDFNTTPPPRDCAPRT
jgi:hypothetical protein